MKRHCQTGDESEEAPSDPSRCDPPLSFEYTSEGGISRSSNESCSFGTMLPAMFCDGTTQNVTTSSRPNSFLHLEMEGLCRPAIEDHKSSLVESCNQRLPEQKACHFGKESLAFANLLKHQSSLAAPNFKYNFASSHAQFNSYQPYNLPEEKPRGIPGKGIQSAVSKDGMISGSPTTIKRNLLRHQSSPATVFSDFGTEAGGVAARHMDQNGLTQLVQCAEYGGMVGYSEEAALSSLCDTSGHSKDAAINLDGTISQEGSLMSILEDSSRGRKRARGVDSFQMNVTSTSNVQDRLSDQGISLTRHVSLPVPLKPKDLPSRDFFLQDAVPCRLRAKRGCATHPRSIAERVRRTRISERMRKLQELVPSLDKQSNTADMLDEVVEYVKFLQRQVQELVQSRARCENLCQQQDDESQPL